MAMGVGTIVPRSLLRLRATKKFQDRPYIFFIFLIIHDLFIFANNRFSEV
jgi:hypothetical protein